MYGFFDIFLIIFHFKVDLFIIQLKRRVKLNDKKFMLRKLKKKQRLLSTLTSSFHS